MRFQVFITSYNRTNSLRQLIEQLDHQASEHAVVVSVYDDCSRDTAESLPVFPCAKLSVNYRRCQKNHGKKEFWRTYNAIFNEAEWAPPADLYVFLPDDVCLCEGFFEHLTRIWRNITDPKKVALNLLLDSRCMSNNWIGSKGKLVSFANTDAWLTGWVDCAFACGRQLFEVLNWHLEPIAPGRWANSEELSSGVGRQISQRLNSAGYTLYAAPWSLLKVLDIASQMHPVVREHTPIVDLYFDAGTRGSALGTVTVSLASIPSRRENLRQVVASLLPQVDKLNVYLNDYQDVPDFLLSPKIGVGRSQETGDLGDAGKFFWCEKIPGWQLTTDDDIVYPPDYVKTLIAKAEYYGRRVVIGVHGSKLLQPFVSYFRSRKIVHCNSKVDHDTLVNAIGTGVACWHSSTLTVKRSDFKLPNMGDIWMSLVAKKQGIPLVVIAHQKGWLNLLQSTEPTLFDRYRHNDTVQTEAINSGAPWEDTDSLVLLKGGYVIRGVSHADHIVKCIRNSGDFYERPLLDRIKKLNPTGVWLDIGAHIGNHSVFFSLECGKSVISLEPDPKLFALLKENVERNAAGCVLCNSAVTISPSGSIRFSPGPPENTGLGRISPTGTLTVSAMSVDSICRSMLNGRKLGLIKIDVEGHESEVLRSGIDSIRRHRPILVIECVDPTVLAAIDSKLKSHHYHMTGQYCATPTYVFEPMEYKSPLEK